MNFIGESIVRILMYSLMGKIYQEKPLFTWRASEPPYTLTFDIMVMELCVGMGLSILIKLFFH
jgi:hypothetical protein